MLPKPESIRERLTVFTNKTVLFIVEMNLPDQDLAPNPNIYAFKLINMKPKVQSFSSQMVNVL